MKTLDELLAVYCSGLNVTVDDVLRIAIDERDAEIAALREQVAGYQRLLESAQENAEAAHRDACRGRRRLDAVRERLRETERSMGFSIESCDGLLKARTEYWREDVRAALAAAEGEDGT